LLISARGARISQFPPALLIYTDNGNIFLHHHIVRK
jgi:hypothetical protein